MKLIWSPAGTLHQNRCQHTVTALPDGRALAIGGTVGAPAGTPGRDVLASMEVWDPQRNAWSSAGSLPAPITAHTATRLQNGHILIVGGSHANAGTSPQPTSRAWLIDSASLRVSDIPPMTEARMGHSATLLTDGRVLVAGGWSGASQHYYERHHESARTCEVWDPRTSAWTPTRPLLADRWSHTAARLADGRVLVMGGEYETPDAHGFRQTVELWNASTGIWQPAVAPTQEGGLVVVSDTQELFSLAIPPEAYVASENRWHSGQPPRTITSLYDVIALGNQAVVTDGNGVAEVFDLGTNTWLPVTYTDPTHPRYFSSGCVLNDGRYLMTGGTRSRPPQQGAAVLECETLQAL